MTFYCLERGEESVNGLKEAGERGSMAGVLKWFTHFTLGRHSHQTKEKGKLYRCTIPVHSA